MRGNMRLLRHSYTAENKEVVELVFANSNFWVIWHNKKRHVLTMRVFLFLVFFTDRKNQLCIFHNCINQNHQK